jgi:rhodanese-related sulfurtransferase
MAAALGLVLAACGDSSGTVSATYGSDAAIESGAGDAAADAERNDGSDASALDASMQDAGGEDAGESDAADDGALSDAATDATATDAADDGALSDAATDATATDAADFFAWPTACSGTVSGATAQSLVAHGAVLVDVRTTTEYAAGHVEGAINIPVGELSSRLGELEKSRPLVVYCASGGRAGNAAILLCGEGYQTYNLGAMTNWPG